MFMRLGALRIRHRRSAKEGVIASGTTSFVSFCFGILEIGTGILFLFGAYTQIAALCAFVLIAIQMLWPHRFAQEFTYRRMFLGLLFMASLSLFITGAGVFGFDLPI
jgi:uncharacterized membrane protein YphA (DoxX/SURF4 family)